jgi:DNA-binding transcriptional LysR family regulator
VQLTTSGLAFIVDARAPVLAADRTIARARSALDPRRPVRVGIVEGALWQPMKDLLRIACAKSIAVELIEGTTGDQLRRARQRHIGPHFHSAAFRCTSRLQVIGLPARPVMVALPADSPISGDDPVPLDVLAEGLIMYLRENGMLVHDAILAMFERRGLKPNITRVTPRVMTGLAMVAAGIGAAIVPAVIAENLSVKGVVFRPVDLDEGIPSWPLSLAYMPLLARSDAAALLAAWQRGSDTI